MPPLPILLPSLPDAASFTADAPALAVLTVGAVALGAATAWALGRRTSGDPGATKDPLTTLATRRALGEHVDDFLRDRTSDEQLTLHVFDLIGFKKYNDSFGFAAGDALLVHLARRVAGAAADHERVYRLRGAQVAVLSSAPIQERGAVRIRIAARLRELGEGFRLECASGTVVIPRQAGDLAEALMLADQELQAERAALRANGLDEGRITPAASAGGLADSPHDVTDVATTVAQLLGLDHHEVDTVRASMRWRDVGMMAIPDAILHAPRSLSRDELRYVRLHTLVGERLLRANFGLHRAATVVRSSHERWDGAGYPDGLAGHDIPIESRIVFVCSAFAAMTAPRSHRAPLPAERALEELRRNASRQFDPQVVSAFLGVYSDAPAPADARVS